MSPKALDSRHAIDSFTFQLHSWRPFHRQHLIQPQPQPKTLDASSAGSATAAANPRAYHCSGGAHAVAKRPCLSDRSFPIEAAAIDMSRLSLADDNNNHSDLRPYGCGGLRLLARKRRRRGSRSVSGRSSDRSGTRRCGSVGASAAYGTCSDFPVAVGTDSSGELFFTSNGVGGAGGGTAGGDPNWSSEVSCARNPRKERDGGGEKDGYGGPIGGLDQQGIESGYGSEPGYRGDAEFGYGDEHDEEEDDARLLFWGDRFEETDSVMEIVGENSFSDQKAHYRCRRKKHDCRMVDSVR